MDQPIIPIRPILFEPQLPVRQQPIHHVLRKRLMALMVVAMVVMGMMPLGASAQDGFYYLNKVQVIELTFTQSNWDYMLDTAMAGSEGYIMGNARINGVVYDSVGVKYKGNSSYNANNVKNPFHIELDHYKNQSYKGYTDIKLSNGFRDPSFVREVLGYEIVRQYMEAPDANFARVYVNGNYLGLYTNVEHVGKKFVEKHFKGDNRPFFKCTPVGGAGPGNNALPSLQYLGRDSALYSRAYEMNSTYGWRELIRLMDTLNNANTFIDRHIDVDRVLWMLALNNVMVNLDSYSGNFAQNYYLSQDDNLRFNPVMWDLNMNFAGFTQTGLGNLSAVQCQQMTPLLHETNAARPLISKLLAIPEFKRRYLSHIRTILDEQFTSRTYIARVQAMQAIADSSVNVDRNKFYTYAQFQAGLTQPAPTGPPGPGGSQVTMGIQTLMNPRITYLSTQASITAIQLVVSVLGFNPIAPAYQDTARLTVRANAGTALVRLGYRDAKWKKFNYVRMYDDGRHDDGAANDQVYGAKFVVSANVMQYYVYAENANAGIHLPARAEFEFFELVAATATINPGDLVINEFLAVNQTDTVDGAGQFEDWIELRNTTTAPISLTGLYLTDDPLDKTKSALPLDATIPAGGYLFIWADNDTAAGEVHVKFKLSSAGESILLSTTTGLVLDSVTFGAQTANVSQSLCGTAPNAAFIATSNTTPGYTNACITSLEGQLGQSQPIMVYPNPTKGTIQFRVPTNSPYQLTIINATGQVVLQDQSTSQDGQPDASYQLGHLPKGVYAWRIQQAGQVFTGRIALQ